MAIANMSLDDLQEKIDAEQQSYFDKLHSAELLNIGKNFTSDEQVDICKVVSSRILKDELDRRQSKIDEILNALVDKMGGYSETMDLIAKEEFIAEIRQIVRLQ